MCAFCSYRTDCYSSISDDGKFVGALCSQLKSWPSNFNTNEILSTLTTLMLRARKGATKIVLTLAKIAEEFVWCHDLLEFVLQEVFTLLSEDRISPILNDVLEDASQKLLVKSCVDGSLLERQTAIRLILLGGKVQFIEYGCQLTYTIMRFQQVNRRIFTITPSLSFWHTDQKISMHHMLDHKSKH